MSLGIPATFIHYALMAVLSLTIVASFEAVGAILAVALLIMPGATARLWTDRMPTHADARGGARHRLDAAGLLAEPPGGDGHLRQRRDQRRGVRPVHRELALLPAARAGHAPVRMRRRLRRTMAVENLLKAIEELGQSAGTVSAVGPGTSDVGPCGSCASAEAFARTSTAPRRQRSVNDRTGSCVSR